MQRPIKQSYATVKSEADYQKRKALEPLQVCA
jgi:hypothetical protein